MKHPDNLFLHAIRQGKPQLGLWMSMASANAAEIIAGAGFDWVMIDMEHSPNDLAEVMSHLQVFAASGTTALVRPDWNDPIKVKRLLDAGAPGLLFPMVQNADEAQEAVRAASYPPNGIRGVSGNTRANQYGRITDYFARVEEETAILLQVETQSALAQVEAIAGVKGVDGIFFGPADISADMGLLGQPMHEKVWDAIREAAKPLIEKSIPLGTIVNDLEFAKQLLDEGFTFVACGSDTGLLAQSADRVVQQMKRS